MDTKEIVYLKNTSKFYISKLYEMYYAEEIEDFGIRLVLLKNNTPVLSKTLLDLHIFIEEEIDLIEEVQHHKTRGGAIFYIFELVKIFDGTDLESIDAGINLMLLHNENIVLFQNLMALPKLILMASIENTISKIENKMHLDGGFISLEEYEYWLRHLYTISDKSSPIFDIFHQHVLGLFDELHTLEIDFELL